MFYVVSHGGVNYHILYVNFFPVKWTWQYVNCIIASCMGRTAGQLYLCLVCSGCLVSVAPEYQCSLD